MKTKASSLLSEQRTIVHRGYGLALLLILLLVNCRTDSSKQTAAQPTVRYTCDAYGWTIQLPPGYAVENQATSQQTLEAAKELLTERVQIDDQSVQFATLRKNDLCKIEVNSVHHATNPLLRWDDYLSGYRAFVYNNYQHLGFTVDSSSQTTLIDHLAFHELHFTVSALEEDLTIEHHIFKRYYPQQQAELVINMRAEGAAEVAALRAAILASEFE
ncbi:MAG: hypothetical protein AAGJ82_15105 [Bacteroidota bacterium]